MNTPDPWSILAEQGIEFRSTSTDAGASARNWEYTIPPLTSRWYGPYFSREEALRAALRHLIAQALASSNLQASGKAADSIAEQSPDQLAAQLESLGQQLHYLLLARAELGLASKADLEPRIDYVIEQIKRIEGSLKQSSDTEQS